MRAETLQVVWHGKDPVYAVDFHPDGTLATAGADREIRLWQVVRKEDGSPGVKHLSTLTNHTKSVNIVRFSPNGDTLASAGDYGELILWKPRSQSGPSVGPAFGEEEEEGLWKYSASLRGHNSDVYDLAWSPDASALLSGSVENIALLWDVKVTKGKARLEDHKHFVQGVAWDPLGEMVVTQSADRTCRVYGPRPPALGKKGAAAAAAAGAEGPSASRLRDLTCQAVMSKLKGAAPGPDGKLISDPMFRDENSGFFKRLSWSPDGSFLAVPGGRFRASPESDKFFDATFVYKRGNWARPVLNLPYPGEATTAVRFSPVLYKLRESVPQPAPAIDLPYRMVFAVATSRSVIIYDTQEETPVALMGMLHYADVTDLAWAPDGNTLVCSSLDGFCSMAVFEPGELGEPLAEEDLPANLSSSSKEQPEAPEQQRPISSPPPAPSSAPAAAAKDAQVLPAAKGQEEKKSPTTVSPPGGERMAQKRRIAPQAVVERLSEAKSGGNDQQQPRRISPTAVTSVIPVTAVSPAALGSAGKGTSPRRITPTAVVTPTSTEPEPRQVVPEALDTAQKKRRLAPTPS